MSLQKAWSRLAWVAVAALLVSCPREQKAPPGAPLSTIRELRERAQAGSDGERTIDLRGVVTFFDPAHGVAYVQDPTGAIAFDVGVLEVPVNTGDIVHLTAEDTQ